MIPPTNYIDAYFRPFVRAVKQTKECTVKEEGVGVDIYPTFSLIRTSDGAALTGSCKTTEQRMFLVAPFQTRWMNLCRQVISMTKADVAFAAVEIYTDHPDHAEPVEAIEISMITPDEVITTLCPYLYNAGREVIWLHEIGPDPFDLNRATAIEIDAARRAWRGTEVAYPMSVRHLSGACGTDWAGHPLLLTAILGQN